MTRQPPSLAFFPVWLAIGYLLVGIVIYLSLMSNPPGLMDFSFGDKIGHLTAYATLMFWFGQLYLRFKQHVIIALSFGLLGVTLEILQGMGGTRMFEYADMAANACGVLLGWGLTRYLCRGFFVRIETRLFVSIPK